MQGFSSHVGYRVQDFKNPYDIGIFQSIGYQAIIKVEHCYDYWLQSHIIP